MIIAVDGPAASGKGTLSSGLAKHYNLPHLDTGLLYRAVGNAWMPFEKSADAVCQAIRIAKTFDTTNLDHAILATPGVGQLASKVAAIPEVRQALFQFQRDFAAQAKGALLDGRDIGTVICPDADVKLYVTADASVRCERRALQMEGRGVDVDRKALLDGILARDARDSGREDAPMQIAEDAVLLDTTQLGIEASLRAAIAIIDGAIENKTE